MNFNKHLYIYGALILAYFLLNLFPPTDDERTNTAVIILFGSILLAYLAVIAILFLKKMKNASKDDKL
ncbi:hypothetical protein ACF3N7_07395 [Cruoricaptor ignavus]|uniref:hypothetical protein n=1 Tax=Cruoricaptor ignavus TaxID=1118202 RepID=UPI00370D3DD5